MEQALSTPLDFRLGEYRVAGAETAIHTLASCPAISSYISNVVLMSAAAAGSSLLLRNRSVINSEYYVYLSNEINQCSVGRKFDEMEIFYHAALAVWPHNGLAIKNMAYHLELEHYLPAAASLYEQVPPSVDVPGVLFFNHCFQ